MSNWLVKNPEIAVWVLSLMVSLLTACAGGILSFLVFIFNKTRALEGELDVFRKEAHELNHAVSKNLSEVCSAQLSVGRELDNLRRTLVGTTVVLQRRKAEVTQIREDAQRARNQMGEINSRLSKSIETLNKHERILTRTI